MQFQKPTISITLPSTAGSGDPRIVIGPDIPTTLQAFYTALGDPIVASEVFYDGLGDYVYSALSESGTLYTGAYDFGNNAIRQRTCDVPTLLNWSISDVDWIASNSLSSESWHTATLQNGWTQTMRYRRVPSPANCVQLSGLILSGTRVDATTVFTLPAGYFPSTVNTRFPVAASSSIAGGRVPMCEVQTDGQVKIYGINVASAVDVGINVVFPLI